MRCSFFSILLLKYFLLLFFIILLLFFLSCPTGAVGVGTEAVAGALCDKGLSASGDVPAGRAAGTNPAGQAAEGRRAREVAASEQQMPHSS